MANKLVETIEAQSRKYGEREAYRFCWRKDGEWLPTSWQEFHNQIHVAAYALAALGIKEHDKIAVCSPNTPQILAAEFGAFRNRASAIPIYSASSQDQFDFIVEDGEASVIFIGDKNQYSLAYNNAKKNPRILKIVVFKNDGLALNPDDDKIICWDDFVLLGIHADEKLKSIVNRRAENGMPDDIATLIYTSGTTGEPKGVVLTHSNYDAAMKYHLERLTNVTDKDISMSFLPMSHILEKAWSYFCITKGIVMAVNYDPRNIQETIHDIHPNLMCCVPRFWEKVYAAVREKIAGMSRFQRLMIARALRVGKKRNLHYKRLGLRVPRMLESEYRFWDRRVFSKLKKAIGIPQPNMFPTAGAPLSGRICEFMRSVGIEIVVGYGLSETTATVTCFPFHNYEIGTVGTSLPEISIRIDENGEILVKGATVTPGYYHNPEANKQAFTADGYFRTGDAGYINDSGALVLTERIKDLFKTSNGKYIAPQALESRMAEDKYIDEAAVIGDQRKFVTALIVPNFPNLRKWAKEHGIDSDSTEQLVSNPKVVKFVLSRIEALQKNMARHEQIKRITLLPHSFSVMNGEVTNTMKVRRPVVARRYAEEIEKMYQE